MSRFLAALKARVQEKRVLESPSEPSKGAFEGFEGDSGRRFFQNEGASGSDPAAWAASLRLVDRGSPLPGFPPHRWVQVINDALIFLDQWGTTAVTLRWTENDLFGVHPVAPACRFDCMGLALLIAGGCVIDLSEKRATLKSAGGSSLRHWKHPAFSKNSSLWHLQNLKKVETDKELRA